MTNDTQPRAIEFSTDDGRTLAGRLFEADGACRGRIVIAGGTGIPQYFYRRFAAYVAQRGYTTATFDYRGIGLSAPDRLKNSKIEFLDWLRHDIPAVVDRLSDGTTPLYIVGHSLGGHGLGFLPEPNKVTGCYCFATGAGWHGWMPFAERLRVLAMWYLVLPPLTRAYGYSPWKMLGMGENLPAIAFYQWRRWCRNRRFFLDDVARPEIARAYAAFERPIVAATALDDAWAPPRSRDALFSGYCNAPVTRIDIDPKDIGMPSIGHVGYFRQGAERLWDGVLDTFETMLDDTRVAHAGQSAESTENTS